MKITFVSPPPNLSGGERVIAIYADRLHARGHDVTIVASRHRVPDWKTHVKAWARGTTPPRPPKVTHYDRMQTPLRLRGVVCLSICQSRNSIGLKEVARDIADGDGGLYRAGISEQPDFMP